MKLFFKISTLFLFIVSLTQAQAIDPSDLCRVFDPDQENGVLLIERDANGNCPEGLNVQVCYDGREVAGGDCPKAVTKECPEEGSGYWVIMPVGMACPKPEICPVSSEKTASSSRQISSSRILSSSVVPPSSSIIRSSSQPISSSIRPSSSFVPSSSQIVSSSRILSSSQQQIPSSSVRRSSSRASCVEYCCDLPVPCGMPCPKLGSKVMHQVQGRAETCYSGCQYTNPCSCEKWCFNASGQFVKQVACGENCPATPPRQCYCPDGITPLDCTVWDSRDMIRINQLCITTPPPVQISSPKPSSSRVASSSQAVSSSRAVVLSSVQSSSRQTSSACPPGTSWQPMSCSARNDLLLMLQNNCGACVAPKSESRSRSNSNSVSMSRSISNSRAVSSSKPCILKVTANRLTDQGTGKVADDIMCLGGLDAGSTAADEAFFKDMEAGRYDRTYDGREFKWNSNYTCRNGGLFGGVCGGWVNGTWAGLDVTCEIARRRVSYRLMTQKVADVLCALSGKFTNATKKQTMYLDANCNIITNTSNYNICQEVTLNFVSPISLMWDDTSKLLPTAVKFPLDPKNPNKFVIWRASAVTPLLVYDPQKTGRITNAEQLFGQHTFGKTWKDGFEALASLDINGDGKISGEELKYISLWFDKNQNGISEPGEVIDIRAAGVTELYYKTDSDDTMTGAVVAVRGYSRVGESSKIYEGSAVDWFSGLFNTKTEAEAEISRLDQKAEETWLASIRSSFNGPWVWEVSKSAISENSANTGGLLIFNEVGGEIVDGVSVIELGLDKNSLNIKSAVVASPLNSFKRINGSKYSFRAVTDDLVAETTMEMSADGRTINGVSRSEAIDPNTGEKVTQHYTWTGRRW